MTEKLEKAQHTALSGMTLWWGEANGCHVQCLAQWPVELYVKPVLWEVAAESVDEKLARRVSQATHDPGRFVKRERTWDDTFDQWQYESVAAWCARAVLMILRVTPDEDEPAAMPRQFHGVALVDADGKQYAVNVRLVP